MNLLEIATSRRTCKLYSDKKIPQDVLNYIFEVTNKAPSSMGMEG